MRKRRCKNCGWWINWGWFCRDCVRAFAAGIAGTIGTVVGTWLAVHWL